jgi:amidase
MTAPAFSPIEATIESIHAGYRGGLTCEAVVQAYLDRIAAFDQKGPALNAFAALNPRALDQARQLDRKLAETGVLVGPLHGSAIPSNHGRRGGCSSVIRTKTRARR